MPYQRASDCGPPKLSQGVIQRLLSRLDLCHSRDDGRVGAVSSRLRVRCHDVCLALQSVIEICCQGRRKGDLDVNSAADIELVAFFRAQ